MLSSCRTVCPMIRVFKSLAGYGFRRILHYIGIFGIVLCMHPPPPPDDRNGRPIELEWKPRCDRFPAPNSCHIVEKAHDWPLRREALSQVLAPVDAGDTHHPCTAGEAPRGMRFWDWEDLLGFGSRDRKERL